MRVSGRFDMLEVADRLSVIKFCRKHNLELSVKAGGTGVHGWSVSRRSHRAGGSVLTDRSPAMSSSTCHA